ncbi:MAG: DUF2723 domain-containing protein [Kofleriaceae bacterium]
MTARERLAWARDHGLLLFAVTLVSYLALAPPHLVGGDNAEFATLGAAGGGVAHPSGFPAYLLWMRLWSWLPGSTPAHVTALSTVLLAVAQVAVLHAAARAWGAKPLAAGLAVAIYAASPIALRTYTTADVFAFNSLVVALVLWLAAAEGPLRGARRVAALGLVAGLGLSNNLTCVLVMPVGLWGAIRGLRELDRGRLRAAALGVGALVVGMTPYVYLFVARGGPLTWGPIDDLGDLVRHFLRLEYGAMSLSSHGEPLPWTHQQVGLWGELGAGWLWLPGALGLGVLGARAARGPARAGWACLAASFVLAGPVLVHLFGLPLVGMGRYIVERFYLLPAELLVVPVAVGLSWIGARVRAPSTPSARVALALAPTIVFLAVGARALVRVDHGHSPAMHRALVRLFERAPERAVIIATGDNFSFGQAYVQGVLGIGTSVDYLDSRSLASPRGERYAAALGISPWPRRGDPVRWFVGAALATGRPVMIGPDLVDSIDGWSSYPDGIMLRVVSPGAPVPAAAEVYADNVAWYDGLDLDYRPPLRSGDWAMQTHWNYTHIWYRLSVLLHEAGLDDEAAAADLRSRQLAPR